MFQSLSIAPYLFLSLFLVFNLANAEVTLDVKPNQGESVSSAEIAVKTKPIDIELVLPKELRSSLTEDEILGLELQIEALKRRVLLVNSIEVIRPNTPLLENGTLDFENSILTHIDGSKDLFASGGGALEEKDFAVIGETGAIMVPSQASPEKVHVVNLTFVQGAKKIKVRMDHLYRENIYNIVVEIPRWLGFKNLELNSEKGLAPSLIDRELPYSDIFEDLEIPPISVKDGVISFSKGIIKIWSLIAGTRQMTPKYSFAEAQRLIQERKLERIQAQLGGNSENRLDRYGEIFEKRFDIEADFRLYDKKFLSQVILPELDRILTDQNQYWTSAKGKKEEQKLKAQFLQTYSGHRLSVEDSQKYFSRFLEEKMQQRWMEAIVSDSPLEEKAPGIALRIQEMIAAKHIAFTIGQQLYKAMANELRNYREELTAKYPVRSRHKRWIKSKIEDKEAKLFPAYGELYNAQVMALLEQKGLTQEAFVFEQSMIFDTYESEHHKAEYLGQQKPAITKEYYLKRWLSKNFEVVEENMGEDPKTGERRIVYRLKDYDVKTTASTHHGWRFWQGFWLDMQFSMKTLSHRIFVDNLMNGPLGLRAFFGDEEFNTRWSVNDRGQIVPSNPRTPLRPFLRQNAANARAAIQRFENSEYHGVWPLKAAHFWEVQVARKAWQQFAFPAFRSGGQFIGTALNFVGFGILGAFTTVGAPVVAFGNNILYRPFIHNSEFSPFTSKTIQGFVPSFKVLLKDMTIKGAGQAALSSLAIGVGTVAGSAVAVVGATDFVISKAADKALVKLFKTIGLNRPKESDWFATHVSGPGISGAGFLYQIDSSVALTAIGLKVEQQVINDYETEVANIVDIPSEHLSRFEEVFGKIAERTPVKQKLSENLSKIKDVLQGESRNDQKKALHNLLKLPSTYRNHIVLDEAGRDYLWSSGAAYLETHFSYSIFPRWPNDKVAKFWSDKNLNPNSWLDLTQNYLAEIFGANINSTLSQMDERIQLEPKDSLQSLLNQLFEGIPNDTLEEYEAIIRRQKKTVAEIGLPQAKPQIVLNSAFIQDIGCGDALIMKNNKPSEY